MELELARVKREESTLYTHQTHFDAARCLNLLPKFNQEDVTMFFHMFEKVAREIHWPEDKWTLLVQSVLEG